MLGFLEVGTLLTEPCFSTELCFQDCGVLLRENLCKLMGADISRVAEALGGVGVPGEIVGRVVAGDIKSLRLNDLAQLAAALEVDPYVLLRGA